VNPTTPPTGSPASPGPRHHREGLLSHALFFAGLLAAVFTNPPIALVLGLVFGLTVAHPLDAVSRRASKLLLQGSVVGLGFGMNLHNVIRVGRDGFLYTILGIVFALAAGMALGALLRVRAKSAFLIATGTAICGGSAIAAVGPLVEASDEEMAVSLGTIFVLNAIALLVFPPIGASSG